MIESIQSISTQGIVREYMPTACWSLVWDAMTQYGKQNGVDQKVYVDAMSRLHEIIPFDRIEKEELSEYRPGLTD